MKNVKNFDEFLNEGKTFTSEEIEKVRNYLNSKKIPFIDIAFYGIRVELYDIVIEGGKGKSRNNYGESLTHVVKGNFLTQKDAQDYLDKINEAESLQPFGFHIVNAMLGTPQKDMKIVKHNLTIDYSEFFKGLNFMKEKL